MTILDPARRNWDVTPQRRVVTTGYRLKLNVELNRKLEQAQLQQSLVYDQTLEHLERHGPIPFVVPANKGASLCKWITSR